MKRMDSAKQQLGRRLVQWGGARAPTREAGFRGTLEGSLGKMAAARGSSSAACDGGCLSEEEGGTVVGGRLLTIAEAAFGERGPNLEEAEGCLPPDCVLLDDHPAAAGGENDGWEEGHPCIPKGEEMVTAA